MSELNFNVTTNNIPKYSNQFNNIVNLNKYLFMTHSYEGTGGYEDGTYLFPFLRESFYDQRKEMSHYRNFVRPLINSLVDPVFNAPIVRETTNALYKKFIESPNGLDSMNEFSKEVALYSRLHGTVFVVMDNFLSTEIPETENEAIDKRILPFAYIQPAYTVYSYKTNKFNQLISITFKDNVIIDDETYCKYTTWDDIGVLVEIKDGDKTVSTSYLEHGLQVIPVIQVNNINKSDILPMPQFYDIARINLAVFNKDSEIRDQERAQAFSIFYMQTDQTSNNTTVGPHNAILIPADESITITPGYVSPDSNILTVLMANNKELIDSIYKISENNGVTAIKQATSGIAESYKFYSQNSQLIKTANFCEEFEKRLASLFSKYVNQDVNLIIKYTKDYSPTINRDSIDNTIKLLSLELPIEVKNEIKSNLINQVLSYMDKNELDELLNKIMLVEEKNAQSSINKKEEKSISIEDMDKNMQ